MQDCLNREYKEDIKCLSNPACCTFILITLLIACIFPIVGIYCYEFWTCPPYMDAVFLQIGLVLDFFIVLVIIIPCFVRLLLNCCYDQEPLMPKAQKVPDPPKTKPPKSAFQSFSETVASGRSKSLEYTENPVTDKQRSRSRSRSGSEV
jgi:hypothetical protein